MIKVLDHGFVELVDKMGNEFDICKSARVSYAANNKNHTEKQDVNLIRYLMNHNHTSPFEMLSLKFHIKLPIFVARQWMRHRTGTFNEISGRYSELPNEFYIPESIEEQSKVNNQGRGNQVVDEIEKSSIYNICVNSDNCYGIYQELLSNNVAKEIARVTLPTNIYTEFYWTVNLHNLLHFLKLRMDKHSQLEIQLYAKCIYNDILKPLYPNICKAFEDYQFNSVKFSFEEFQIIKSSINNSNIINLLENNSKLSNREKIEFKEKLGINNE